MTLCDLKICRLTNQYLTVKTDRLSAARDLCGFQAQFMANALHSMKIRCYDFSPETVAAGLVKNWTVRGTVHVFAESDLPLFLHRSRAHISRPGDLPRGNCCINAERNGYFAELIVDMIGRGIDSREALKAGCAAAGMTVRDGETIFEPWGGTIRTLCESGYMCYMVQEKKAFLLCPPFYPMEEGEANLEIAQRYFTNFAPVSVRDAMYFFHATKAQVNNWLTNLPVTTVECDGNTYYYIENGKRYDDEIPDCIFLAGFDQLMLGYQKTENPFLPYENIRGIYNLAGIVMPPILLHGRVVGKWRKKDSRLTLTMFENVVESDRKLINNTAGKLWDNIRKIEWQ